MIDIDQFWYRDFYFSLALIFNHDKGEFLSNLRYILIFNWLFIFKQKGKIICCIILYDFDLQIYCKYLTINDSIRQYKYNCPNYYFSLEKF